MLHAALEAAGATGLGGLTMEGIAARAQVSKATVYKWWRSPADIALEGLLEQESPTLAWPDTGDFLADLNAQVRALLGVLRGPRGRMIRAVVAAAQHDRQVADAFVRNFLAPRRADACAAYRRAQDRGQLRDDVDPEVGIDLVYSPLYFRLLVGHQPLDDTATARIIAAAWHGLAPDHPGARGSGSRT